MIFAYLRIFSFLFQQSLTIIASLDVASALTSSANNNFGNFMLCL